MNKKQLSVLAIFNLSFHWFAVGIIVPVMTLFLLEKGMTLFQVGIIFASYSFTTVLMELPTGGLADTVGRKKVYLIALIFQILGGILILFVETFTGLILCSIFQGVSRSLSSGTMDAHFIDEFYKIDPQVNLQKEMAKIGIFIPLALGAGSLLGGFLPMTLGKITVNFIQNNVYASNCLILIGVVIIQFLSTLILVKEEKRSGTESLLQSGYPASQGARHPRIHRFRR